MTQLKTVFAPHLNATVKFGRRQPRIIRTKMKASNLIDLKDIGPVPDTTDFRSSALTPLRNIYANDELGDCVPAWLAHLCALMTGAAGDPFVPTRDQVIKMYEAIGGYVPGNPATDQGCDEDTAISYVEQTGFPNGTKALGAISVDATNPAEIHAIQWLFENTMFGVGLPDAWVSPFPSKDGVIWDKAGAADPNNGHCFGGVDNHPKGLVIDSWGLFLVITFEAIAEYAVAKAGGQLFAILTPDQIKKGMAKAPNGVDWSTIISSFNARGGNVPLPAPDPDPTPAPTPPDPSPTPAPTPTPSSAVTLAQATHWATANLAHAPRLVQRAQAVQLVAKGLKEGWPKP